ncbi:MAG: hypothetical protein LBK66_00830 [Spirochaetaceae bacterium]|nr:hypothetical protein [Spirochaetaceae bacterium]
MRNKLLITGMLAGLLTFGFVMVGCDHNSRPDKDAPPPDKSLVGEWYDSAASAAKLDKSGLRLTFTADGKVLFASDGEGNYSISYDNEEEPNKIITIKDSSGTTQKSIYSINGAALVITGTLSANAGTISAGSASYYKKQ